MPLDDGKTKYQCEHTCGDLDTVFFKLVLGTIPDEIMEALSDGAEVTVCSECDKAFEFFPPSNLVGWGRMNQAERWEALQAEYRRTGRAYPLAEAKEA